MKVLDRLTRVEKSEKPDESDDDPTYPGMGMSIVSEADTIETVEDERRLIDEMLGNRPITH